MKICEACNLQLDDNKKYCTNCGKPLFPKIEQTSPTQARPDSCPSCGKELPNGNIKFCLYCGARLKETDEAIEESAAREEVFIPLDDATEGSVTEDKPESAKETPSLDPVRFAETGVEPDVSKEGSKISVVRSMGFQQRLRKSWLLLSVSTTLVIALVIAGYFYFLSTKRSIISKIQAGELVKPEGDSAYDLYLEYVATNPSPDEVAEISDYALPVLQRRGDEILGRLQNESLESEADWAECIRICDWLNHLQPDKKYESRKYFSLGRLAFLKGQNSDAIANYQRSIQLDNSWAVPYNAVGRAMLRVQDRKSAREYYQRATETEPNWIFPWINLGALNLEMGDYVKSETSLRRALEIDRQKASAHFFLAQTLEKLRQPCDALREYQLALENAHNSASPGFSVDFVRSKIARISSRHPCN